MAYSITIRKSAIKALEKINEPYYSKIKEAIYNLAKTPRPVGCKKLKGRDGFRIHVSDYRIIYEIFEEELLIDIIDLGHRRDIYKR
jgi:mRNA interferase RelE/StbE